MAELTDDELQRIYTWVDEVPLTRPKRNIARDFADGVLTAEICLHYYPRLVEIHNYPSANSFAQKMYNWNTLNAKVFKKMGFQLRKDELDAIVNNQPQAVERMLKQLQAKMAEYGRLNKQVDAGAGQQPAPATNTRATPRAPASAAPAARRLPLGPGAAGGGGGGLPHLGAHDGGVAELLAEKDHNIRELRETVDILEIKIQKLEQLVRLKDSKIATLQGKLQTYEYEQ